MRSTSLSISSFSVDPRKAIHSFKVNAEAAVFNSGVKSYQGLHKNRSVIIRLTRWVPVLSKQANVTWLARPILSLLRTWITITTLASSSQSMVHRLTIQIKMVECKCRIKRCWIINTDLLWHQRAIRARQISLKTEPNRDKIRLSVETCLTLKASLIYLRQIVNGSKRTLEDTRSRLKK